ncbi:MAG: circularly permuted type 2 ATP-grasp protein [Rhizobiaceae bacterium]|nr:circularly permuted type 2 ATP-grasp protein [Rhizobiaceae bacterium]
MSAVPDRARQPDPTARLLAGYRTLPGVPDELKDAAGNLRPAWASFAAHFAELSPGEVAKRFARGDQYLRDAGVFFRQYRDGQSTERDWPLAHVPVLIAESEWKGIEAGLIQRADLLERVVADLYGSGRLVADGHLPASLVAMSPEWLRPLVGVAPRGRHFLNFVAFEIGRGPDGKWWVLGDRTQAPSGAGFALENRVATSRVFADFYADSAVHRLAGFFRAFRDALMDMRESSDSRVAILSPGPLNETYYEHAYIARYLGFMLLEGEDLTVEGGRLMVRTVAGLSPVSVLWRRLDAAFADPLELDESSRLGTPGLVRAVREGSVTMVNALGAGVLETRALLAFLPRICEALTGRPLLLPNIATWWCGQQAERDAVLANADRMTISPALSTRLPFEADAGLPGDIGRPLAEILEQDGALLVGQEAVTLSTTPAYVGGRLAPRPMSIRVFLARTRDGWQVMPGGYARIGRSDDPAAIAMQKGGSVADVWVVADRDHVSDTMLPTAETPFARAAPGALPSRAADNLYWLGRYVERAEGLMRLLRAYHTRLAETGDEDAPLPAALAEYLSGYGADTAAGIAPALIDVLGYALNSASRIRDRFSVDGWMALNDLLKTTRRMAGTVQPGDDAARAMSVLLRKIAGFSGLVHENMYRFTGWRFLTIGRALERALSIASVLAAFTGRDAPDGALDLVIEIGDSVMTHRRRYSVTTSRGTVIDLLALDESNPRAILYQLTEIRDQLALLPGAGQRGQLSPLQRLILELHTAMSLHTPETVDAALLGDLRGKLAELSDLLSDTYLV